MERLFNFLLDLALGKKEDSFSKRVPKAVRYAVLVLILAVFVGVFGFLLVAGILFLKTDVRVGIVLILIAVFLGAFTFAKGYYEVNPSEEQVNVPKKDLARKVAEDQGIPFPEELKSKEEREKEAEAEQSK